MRIIPRIGSPIYTLLAFLLLATVTVLLVLPGETFPKVDFDLADKIVHLMLFLGMVSSFSLGIPAYRKRIVIGVIVYGVLMEFVQKYWCINRSFSIADMIADAIGCFLGLAVANAFLKSEKK